MKEMYLRTLAALLAAGTFGAGGYAAYDYTSRLASDRVSAVMAEKQAKEQAIIDGYLSKQEEAVDDESKPKSVTLKSGQGFGITIPLAK